MKIESSVSKLATRQVPSGVVVWTIGLFLTAIVVTIGYFVFLTAEKPLQFGEGPI